MRKIIILLSVIALSLVLASCGRGDKDADVIKGLGEKVEKIEEFEANAVMEITENEKTHVFDVNVKYQEPNFYKVSLTNRDNDNVQVILKNDDGVFVLTPALNKSFKFQSDWPLNSSQPYLYQSLVQDILNDDEPIYVKEEGNYVFDTECNYRETRDLTSQKIIINGKTLLPMEVTVKDSEENTKIHVLFNDFNVKPSLNENEFEIDYSMQTAQSNTTYVIPTLAERDFVYPTYLAEGVEQHVEATVDLTNTKRYVMGFQGDQNYFVYQEYLNTEETMTTDYVYGDIIITGNGVAEIINDSSLKWIHNGIEFRIDSEELTVQELIDVSNQFTIPAGK
ncbi:LolA family protein [Haloplasma contractile]|uniref:Lipoprotein putative n=1 Tax=Haloplasma contractile SSD-17B TaxID=1033810 RepID=U2E7T0_9MOLU|nr:outer membrane lipoprotein carrier protein LolA [Haloplasma contractile]ERJ10951.1 Lipoprotein putative [Haloplasma contractile SSD-17B]ERJ12959.1 Lipoprotein putative [Haloplasma contractile SSD-17B]